MPENKIERYWEYPVTKKVRGKYLNDMNILKFNNTCWTFSWMLNVWEGGVWQKTADIGKNIAWKIVKGTKIKNLFSNEGLINYPSQTGCSEIRTILIGRQKSTCQQEMSVTAYRPTPPRIGNFAKLLEDM